MAPGSVQNLPFHRLPETLGGGGTDTVFAIDRDDLGPDLVYRSNPRRPAKHGFIEPARPMTIEQYQIALAATRDRWFRYHPGPPREAP